MTNLRTETIKKSAILMTVLLIGALVPYLSRIPLSFTYGTNWIWKYMSTYEDFLRWNLGHLVSLVPVAFFGLLFVFGKEKAAFYGSILGNFGLTCLIYYNFEESYHPDDFLGCILFPIPIGIVSVIGGITGLLIFPFYNWLKNHKEYESA